MKFFSGLHESDYFCDENLSNRFLKFLKETKIPSQLLNNLKEEYDEISKAINKKEFNLEEKNSTDEYIIKISNKFQILKI